MAICAKPVYRRILLKLSGEVLQGTDSFGIDDNILVRIAQEVEELVKLNIQIGIVIGGGNLFRGAELIKAAGISRVVADHMGMLATIINGLAICSVLHSFCIKADVMSAISLYGVCDSYNWVKAMHLLHNHHVVIFVAGTGNPFFTTDSAACLRGIEIKADVVLKATKVNGVFSTDPVKHPNAIFYDQLSYQDVLERELKVMDLAAFTLARDHDLPIRIFNMNKPKALWRIVMGHKEGTLITK
ncbi:UMP kinase [Blochmannia endosymbiont of Camponotus (Colobopsis) obliquus]|uniref:UMP kinase n=1 Tax=Blochmannia endosymbiont of Camponotus (Colobopsis) obliquus TaxID=1505597 RepID=UPI00061A79F6|nr:UMP kinase [Blochmannia endosymbiont of Camponotus (Colobopsis) obliquus]AKC60439.1 Uridylate kinase [Blochmannia endosymbiont of Camponotus (Colobopsis) obliquus]